MKNKQLTTRRVPVDSLKADPANARKHDKKNLDAIAASLNRFGQVEPLVVQKSTGIVIGGNGRLEAMRKAKWTEVDIVEVDIDSTQAAALGVALNRTAELAEWDKDILGKLLHGLQEDGLDLAEIGFQLDDLESFKELDFGTSGITEENQDEVPEVKDSFVKRGEIWQLGDHRLMCGDSTDAASVTLLMAGEKADMVFTDPPYSVSYGSMDRHEKVYGRKGKNHIENDSLSTNETAERIWGPSFTNAASVSKEDASIYVTAPQGGDQMMMMMMMKAFWQVKHELIWVKPTPAFSMGRLDYDYQHEPIIFGWKKKHQFFGKGQYTKSVWHIDRDSDQSHPTMKPVALIENAILNSTENSMMVLDLFLGSGSTLIACEKTGRKCFGMEIDPHYCSVIVKRWQDATGKTAVKVG